MVFGTSYLPWMNIVVFIIKITFVDPFLRDWFESYGEAVEEELGGVGNPPRLAERHDLGAP